MDFLPNALDGVNFVKIMLCVELFCIDFYPALSSVRRSKVSQSCNSVSRAMLSPPITIECQMKHNSTASPIADVFSVL